LAWQPAFQSGSLERYSLLMDSCALRCALGAHWARFFGGALGLVLAHWVGFGELLGCANSAGPPAQDLSLAPATLNSELPSQPPPTPPKCRLCEQLHEAANEGKAIDMWRSLGTMTMGVSGLGLGVGVGGLWARVWRFDTRAPASSFDQPTATSVLIASSTPTVHLRTPPTTSSPPHSPLKKRPGCRHDGVWH